MPVPERLTETAEPAWEVRRPEYDPWTAAVGLTSVVQLAPLLSAVDPPLQVPLSNTKFVVFDSARLIAEDV